MLCYARSYKQANIKIKQRDQTMQSIYEPKSRPDNYGYWAFIGTVTMDDNSKKNIQTIILLYSYDGVDRISMLGDSGEYFFDNLDFSGTWVSLDSIPWSEMHNNV